MSEGEDFAALASEASAAWPELRLPEDRFVAYLRERIDPALPLAEQPLRAHLGDLWLACGCAHGDSNAIAAFGARYGGELVRLFARPDRRGTDASDLVQGLLEHLFVRTPDRAPRISEYLGRGSLRTWLRVVALRLRINAERGRAGKEAALPTPAQAMLPDSWDFELEYVKERYRESFREAFGHAIAGLDARDRGLLRLHVVHGLSATAIAGVFGVHRATAKRWLASVREQLLERTRAQMAELARLDQRELDSVMGLIGSRLEASVRRFLDSSVERGGP
ncbi:MAG TPA: sigma-70 family RNA polymerase sigma factor [Nannocystaceae bacterium]|nr:sigma-70 family RNA polymerase sigma factor [Nannocystaceae bacterium]